MSSQSTSPLENSTLETKPVPEQKPASKEGSRYVQEKVMLALTLVFFAGVFALTVVPEPFRGAAMGLIIFLTVIAMFKFS